MQYHQFLSFVSLIHSPPPSFIVIIDFCFNRLLFTIGEEGVPTLGLRGPNTAPDTGQVGPTGVCQSPILMAQGRRRTPQATWGHPGVTLTNAVKSQRTDKLCSSKRLRCACCSCRECDWFVWMIPQAGKELRPALRDKQKRHLVDLIRRIIWQRQCSVQLFEALLILPDVKTQNSES